MPENVPVAERVPVFPAGCLPVTAPEARALLASVRVIYTDLDGTLLAPGGRLLADHAGTPSTATADALVALKSAEVTVVPVTGRGADQGTEFLRLMNLDCYIGEVGGYILRREAGARIDERYLIGAWERVQLAPGLASGELPAGVNPWEFIGQSGVIERLQAAFPQMFFPYHVARSVSWSFWGNIDVERAARAVLAREELPLQLFDNGILYNPPGELPDGAPVHIYHLLPAGVSKRLAIATDRESRELSLGAALAIGDSAVDLEMSEECGVFVMMANGLRNPEVQEAVAARLASGQTVLHTTLATTDGWVEMARALLAAQGRP